MSEPSPTLPLTPAEDLHLAAFLRELHGERPAPDLADRILARAARRPAPGLARRRAWLVAALLLAGTAAVIAVAVQEHRRQQSQAPAANETEAAPDGQDSASLDPALRQRMERAIRALELAERRDAAIHELGDIGPAAAPILDAALQAETGRGRADVSAALRVARFRADCTAAKAAAGLPAEPITLFADYADNSVVAVDRQGKKVFELKNVFGPWDVELTPDGTLLCTMFSVSQVAELGPLGNVVWAFEDLKNPYDADRLSNGNTLIADTYAGRVIEVDRDKKIVWQFDADIRPFDCDRLPNGNTLIADVLGEG